MQFIRALMRRRPKLLLCLTLVVLVLWAFLPSLADGFVDYDDPDYITQNPHVKQGLTWDDIRWAFTSAHAGNWHPLTWIAHQADWQIYGAAAWGHHLSSMVLHTATVVLVFLLLAQLTGAVWRSYIVALFFGVHPLRVESVTWLSERKDVLSTLFFALTIWAYARFAMAKSKTQSQGPIPSYQNPEARSFGKPGKAELWYFMGLVFYALGLLAKPMLVTLPFVLLLLDYWPLCRWPGKSRPKVDAQTAPTDHVSRFTSHGNLIPLLTEKMPFFVLAVVVSVVTFVVQKQGGAITEGLPLLGRIENALVAYVRYIGKIVCPVHLSFFYPPVPNWPVLLVMGAFLFLLAVSFVALLKWRVWPWFLVGWLWFVGTLVPVIGLIPAGEHSLADRYSYIPSLGLVWLGVWLLADLLKRWNWRVLAGATAVLTLVSGVLTRQQARYWRDDETLFGHALEVTRNNYVAHNNLGTLRDKQRRWDEAIAQFNAALEAKPRFPQALCNLGIVLFEQGRIEQAAAQFEQALSVNPKYAVAYNDLGHVFESRGHLEQALDAYATAARLKPDSPDAHYNSGLLLLRQRKYQDAMREFRTTLRLQPDSADAYNNIGLISQELGNFANAIDCYRHAVLLRPDYARAHFNLGVALYESGFVDPAIAELQEALRIKPDYLEARKNLNALLAARRGQ